jgi:hypothetical protein
VSRNNAAPAEKKDEQAPIASDKPNGLDMAAIVRQMEQLADQNKQLQARIEALGAGGKPAKAAEITLTKDGQYVASARGHIPGLGVIEPGQAIPAGIPVGSWMKAAKKKKAEAEDKTLDD